ncbi:major facilitator superfamily domain-containing protein [Lentinula raphanica]|uniref:Major facilitator superfamily domain-containing protein n=1 Tax=Lentinula raphanica TaxID=153919 RepID=A0AA38NZI5_9AGAR|nr:major facilitator superfamily domain-containing protein [Lentinula raphanica]
MSTSSKDDAAPSISYTEQAPDRRNIPDSELIGTHPFSAARLWNREPLDEFYREALEKYPNETSIDPVEELKLRRKIDRLIIPCLAVCYAFYYIDKTTLSYAAIFGIKTDLKLHGTEYSWLSSLFYFGWLAWGLPSNLLMQRSPSGKYLAINIFLWGVLLMAQAASRNFTELAVLRILSGAFEAIADPAFMLITTMFYRRAEQPSRISMWYAANGVGVAGGGLLGYAIGHIKGSLASWKYEFLIVGSLCSLWGFVLFFVLPDSPATARALTRDERLLAVGRLRENQTGVDNKKFKWDQFRETFLDPKSWLFFALGLVGNIPNGGISNFSTLIIQGLGFDTLQTTLLGIPQGALVCIWIGLGAYLNGRLPPNSRTLVCILFMLPTIAGTLGFLLAPQDASVGRLICYYLTGSYQSSFVLGLSLITSNTAGQTKKQLTSALIWLGACVGNISGPFFYRTQDAPTYHLGIGSMLVSNCLEVLIFVALRVYLSYQNRKRDAADLAAADSGAKQGSTTTTGDVNDAKDAKDSESLGGLSAFRPHENETAFADMTDLQNVNFRYVY